MKNKSTQRQNSGFTVIEMIVYGVILSLFVIVLSTMFSSILDTQLGSETNTALVQDGRYLLSRFSYDIGRASSVSVPVTPGATSSTLTLTIGGNPYVYAVNNGNLEITDTSGTYRLNSFGTRVSGLSFARYGTVGGKNSIQIRYTLTSTTERVQGAETRDFQSAYSLR